MTSKLPGVDNTQVKESNPQYFTVDFGIFRFFKWLFK